MNPENVTFLRQKSTGVKFVRIGSADPFPVSALPGHALHSRLSVKCEKCEAWHIAANMSEAATGLLCHSCAPVVKETREAAMEKAAKLLRLAQSDNPNEAAVAAAKAQEIIDRWNLSAAMLSEDGGEPEPEEDIQDFGDSPLNERDASYQHWKGFLAQAVAAGNQCEVYKCGSRLCLVGRPSDVVIVRSFYTYLVGEVDRLAVKVCKGHGVTYHNNFRLGAVDTIQRRLEASRAETVEAVKAEALTNGGESALVLVQNSLVAMERKKQEVAKWAKEKLNLRSGRSYRTTRDDGARAAGRRAGETVDLRRPSGALPSGTKSLR